MSAEPWVTDPSIDLSLGDEVIASVLAGLNLSCDPGRGASEGLDGAQFETGPQFELGASSASGKPRVSCTSADLGLGDEVIEAFLSGPNQSRDARAGAAKGRAGAEPRFAGIEPSATNTPADPKSSSTPADPRVSKIFAPKVSKIPVAPKEITDPSVSSTPAAPTVFNVPDEPWITNIPIEQWAQGSLRLKSDSTVAPPPETKEHPTKPPEREQRKTQSGINAKVVILLCAAFVAAAFVLLALTGLLHVPKFLAASNPSVQPQLVSTKPTTTNASAGENPAEPGSARGTGLGVMARSGVPSSSRVSGSATDDRKAVLLTLVRPVYPPMAKKLHLTGDVNLEVHIATDGSVHYIRVLSGSPTLVQAAIDAVRQWRYQPALKNGTPVAGQEKIVVPFRENQ
jgi:TonB family protein